MPSHHPGQRQRLHRIVRTFTGRQATIPSGDATQTRDGAQIRWCAAARRLIGRCVAEAQSLYVPVTVTLEVESVLRASYGVEKEEVLQVLSNLFSAADLSFESERALEVALQLFREGSAEFADCLHIALAAEVGEQPLWTFDKGAAKVFGAQ